MVQSTVYFFARIKAGMSVFDKISNGLQDLELVLRPVLTDRMYKERKKGNIEKREELSA